MHWWSSCSKCQIWQYKLLSCIFTKTARQTFVCKQDLKMNAKQLYYKFYQKTSGTWEPKLSKAMRQKHKWLALCFNHRTLNCKTSNFRILVSAHGSPFEEQAHIFKKNGNDILTAPFRESMALSTSSAEL